MLASARRTLGSVFRKTRTSSRSSSTLSSPFMSRFLAFAAAKTSALVGRNAELGQRTLDQVNRYIHRYSPSEIRWLRQSAEVKPAPLVPSRSVRVSGGKSLGLWV